MKSILVIFQIIISIFIIVIVLIQDQGSGIGEAFGESGAGFSRKRRGMEKWIHISTIVALILFAIISISILLL